MQTKTTIKCPNCNTNIDVNDILYHQLEEEIKQKNIAEQKKFQKALDNLKVQEESVKEQKEKFDDELKKATQLQVKLEKQKLHESIKKELQDEQSESMALLKKELDEKSDQVKKLNKSKAEVEKLKREKSEIVDKIKADSELEFNNRLQEEKDKFKVEQEKLKSEETKRVEEIGKLKKEREELKQNSKKEFAKLLDEKLKTQKLKTEEETKLKITQETSEQFVLLKKELDEKSEQVKELNNSKVEIQKLKREKEEIESKIKADSELEFNQQLKIEREKIQKESNEKNELRLKEKDEQLKQIKRQLDETKRKAEQGSQQIQGEAHELVIESWLVSQFPFDNIDEVKKGAFGADCVQTIHTRELQNCGIICYESKNAKSWSVDWIKHDMLKAHADIGVLVTQVMPNGMERMGFVDGIWVCSLEEFKGSVSLLRESLIRVHKTVQKEDNKSDKMHLLYSYLSGNEFSMQLSAIVDGFMKMQEELDKERRSLMGSWKRRQKTIDGVLANTTEMYGSLQGIAGNSIVHVKALEPSYEALDKDEKSK